MDLKCDICHVKSWINTNLMENKVLIEGAPLPCWPIPWCFFGILHSLPRLLGRSCLVWTWSRRLPDNSWHCGNIFHLSCSSPDPWWWNPGSGDGDGHVVALCLRHHWHKEYEGGEILFAKTYNTARPGKGTVLYPG